jgi:hypothetical protein
MLAIINRPGYIIAAVVTGKRLVAAVLLLLWYSDSNGRVSPVITVGHVTYTWLLLVSIVTTDRLTSADRC